MSKENNTPDSLSIIPERDEIRAAGVKSGNGRNTASRSRLGAITLTLLLVCGVAIAVLALQQYSSLQMLDSYEERLELANDRIVALEQALTQTDESVSMNGTAINAQFQAIKAETEEQMSEIRKLWDVANKRNRQWIEDNQALLVSHQERLVSLESSSTELDDGFTELQASLARLDDRLMTLADAQTSQLSLIDEQSIRLDEQAERFSALDSLPANVEALSEQLDAELLRLTDLVVNLDVPNYDEQLLTLTINQENQLSEQSQLAIAQSDAAIQLADFAERMLSVDVGRRETSQRLAALTNQLSNLEARVQALTSGQ